MALTINSLFPLTVYRYLRIHQEAITRSMERLSSGFRINRAADDLAGYAITEEMTKKIKGLEQAERNAQDALSLLQEADRGMEAIDERLQRLRTLAVRAASATYTSADRIKVQNEVDQLVAEIDRIASATKFNNIQILKGLGGLDIHVGAGRDETIRIRITSVDVNALGIRGLAVTGASNTNANYAISSLDAALSIKIRERSEVGAYQVRLEGIINYLRISQENAQAARSRIREADLAQETMNLARSQILRDSALAILAQANLDARSILRLL